MALPDDGAGPMREATEPGDREGVGEELEVDDTAEVLEALGEESIDEAHRTPRPQPLAAAIRQPLPARGLARHRVSGPGTSAPKPHRPPANLQALTGHDVELRTLSGGCYRGELIAVTPEWALLERRTGKLALVSRAALAAACDENFGGTP